MPDVSPKVLAEQLNELIADDIVQRQETGKVPAPVIYSLTEYGRTILPVLVAVRIWGQRHIERFGNQEPDQESLDAASARASASLEKSIASGG